MELQNVKGIQLVFTTLMKLELVKFFSKLWNIIFIISNLVYFLGFV
jgi:hypothetical protein